MGRKEQKCDFFKMKNCCHFVEYWAIGRNFALYSRTTKGMCMQNVIGISAILRALVPSQTFDNTFWILWRRRRRLQHWQKHIGPTLLVGPNEIKFLIFNVRNRKNIKCLWKLLNILQFHEIFLHRISNTLVCYSTEFWLQNFVI